MEDEYDVVNTDEMLKTMRTMGLAFSITKAFDDASPQMLRRWYVETFVLDPNNRSVLKTLGTHPHLEGLFERDSWVSTEHKAIGFRLLFEINPNLIARGPNLLEPEHWSNEDDIALTMMRLFKPWERMRFDPDGENWYTAVLPGQWRRFGKGPPSCGAVEERIAVYLNQMDPVNNLDNYREFPMVSEGMAMDEVTARQMGVQSRFRKFKGVSLNKSRIRQVFERSSVMHLDPSTLNQIRTMTPFANGALALVDSEYFDTLNKKHRIRVGDLLPLDIEYMVMNANPIPWLDSDRRIPKVASDPLTREGDFVKVKELEDELLFAHCPTYWSFLRHAFPDHEEHSAFLRLLGAAMYGTNLKIVAALIGSPNAGKDTSLNWLNYVMPGQVATLPFSAFTPHGDDDRGFAPLRGARVATVSGEVGDGRGSKLLAEKIKTVSSGGGKVRVAEKYEKPSDIWFDGMLFLQGNSVPQIAGGDRALYENRLVAVEFKHPFPLVSASYEALYRAEAPWFAQILFLNYLQYQGLGGGMNGIAPPDSWRSFAKEFADASNPHGFLEACITKSEDPIPTTQFHQALSAMAQRYGSPFPVGPNYWPKRLRTLDWKTKGPDSVRKQVMKNGKPTWCYYLTLDSSKSDGMFDQEHWERILRDAGVTT